MNNNVMKREQTAKQPAAFGSVVDQIFQNNLSRFFDDSFWGSDGFSSRSGVPVNIRETDKTYEMELVAPGLKKEDFHLNITSDTFTVSFEHNEENKNEGWLHREYRKQSFVRTFNVDDTVDVNNISARYENGILHVTLPKKENAQKVSRNIQVQ